jgi:glycosyltransferase involved in cell wall biosynthesis
VNVLIFNPRSINHSRAGGAEIYLHEILTRINDLKFLVLSSSDRKKYSKSQTYLELLISKSEFFFPLFSLKFTKFVSQVDIVIESISKFPLIWPLFISKLSRKPFVGIIYHIHANSLFRELPLPVAFILYIYEKFALKLYAIFGAYMVTISASTKQELKNLGFPSDKIVIIPVGLTIQCKKYELSKSEEPLIVYIGRIKKYKRLDHLIRAMADIRQAVPHVLCVIAGKSDEKVIAELRKLTKKLKLEKNIIFKTNISELEKQELLRKAWVYVIPSIKEGFSISALEAQACGTPVVGYAIPGLVDCVENGVTGFLVRDGDYKNLAQAIKILLLSKETRLKMSKNAIARASTFKWEISARKFKMSINRWIRC